MISLADLMQISTTDQLIKLDTSFFHALPFHFYWKDKEGKYLGCNDTQALFAGLNKGSDLLGYNDFDFCWRAIAPVLTNNDREVMLHNKPKVVIEPIMSSKRLARFALSYKTPLHIHGSTRTIGIIGASFLLNDEAIIDHSLNHYDFKTEEPNSKPTRLTQRQSECLYHLIKGMTIKMIAKKLNLSPKTVEHYLRTVKSKLACNNRADLITKGLQLPYIQYRFLIDKGDIQ